MKIPPILAILITSIVAQAGDKTPVVVPFQGAGTATTSQFGSGYINRDNSGGSTTTSKFGNGIITRGDGGASSTTTTFGTGFITRGAATTSPAKNPATSSVILLPARK